MTTPIARLASDDFGPAVTLKQEYSRWLIGSIVGWTAFVGFLFFFARHKES